MKFDVNGKSIGKKKKKMVILEDIISLGHCGAMRLV